MKDAVFMRRALELAQSGHGWVAPNPVVGAILVHEGRIIGEGYHALYGSIHAEVACIEAVAPEDRHLIPESTMYVSLEPCSHQGKQPPCAQRLIYEKIRRVVVCNIDPFPAVSGRGISMLRDSGIQVSTDCCQKEGRWVNRRFLQTQEQNRPYVILKWAASSDGYIAPSDGSRQQLSNHFSQTLVHKWRIEESAILVGSNTARSDNPQLNVRLWSGKAPLRLVFDRKLQLPGQLHLMDGIQETWVINETKQAEGNPRYLKLDYTRSILPQLLLEVKNAGCNSILVEGGAQVLNSFINENLWDEARVFHCPVQLGNQSIAAPQLPKANLVYEASVGSDNLKVYLPQDSTFDYMSTCAF